MGSITDRRKEINKIIAETEEVGEIIKKQSEKLYDQSIDTVIDKNDSVTPYVLASLVIQQINNSLRKIVKTAEDSFEKIIKKNQKYLVSQYGITLTKADLTAISKTESFIIEKLLNNTDILKSDIRTILYSNLGRGVPKSELIKKLKELYPAYSRNASTIINTGIGAELQDINISKFEQTDFNWYIWAGPNDKLTRELPCRHWVNHKFPSSQLSTLRVTRSSLWNCRHSVIPISDEEAENYPTGDISIASGI